MAFTGKYRGYVWDNRDPLKQGRVQVIVESLCPTALGWALPSGDLGRGPGFGGAFIPPDKKNDSKLSWVWIEFEDGSLSTPVWSGGFFALNNNYSDIFETAQSDDDFSTFDKLDISVQMTSGYQLDDEKSVMPLEPKTIGFFKKEDDTPLYDLTLLEPPSANKGVYPHVRGFKSPSGHLFELDDTPGAERVQLYHRKGSYIEYAADGSRKQKSVGSDFDFILGSSVKYIEKDLKLKVGGNFFSNYDHELLEVIGSHKTTRAGGLVRTVSRERSDVVKGRWYQETNGKVIQNFKGGSQTSVIGNRIFTCVGESSEAYMGEKKEKYLLPFAGIDITNPAGAFSSLTSALNQLEIVKNNSKFEAKLGFASGVALPSLARFSMSLGGDKLGNIQLEAKDIQLANLLTMSMATDPVLGYKTLRAYFKSVDAYIASSFVLTTALMTAVTTIATAVPGAQGAAVGLGVLQGKASADFALAQATSKFLDTLVKLPMGNSLLFSAKVPDIWGGGIPGINIPPALKTLIDRLGL